MQPERAGLLFSAAPKLGTPPKPTPIPGEPRHTWVYFFQDGGVSRLTDTKPDEILFSQAYLVMVSVPRGDNTAPYVEIVKSDHGAASIIMTADVPSPAPQSSFLEEEPREDGMFHTRIRFVGDGPDPCRGGDYCDEVCNGGIGCGKVNGNG